MTDGLDGVRDHYRATGLKERLKHGAFRRQHTRHRERNDAIQGNVGRSTTPGSPRRQSPSERRASLDALWLLAMTML
jgi:hypothetical protein